VPTATPTPAPPAFIEHVVGAGDNLSYIASLYGSTVNAIAAPTVSASMDSYAWGK
jgi:hypothetical protein